jgi:hypothetical protein
MLKVLHVVGLVALLAHIDGGLDAGSAAPHLQDAGRGLKSPGEIALPDGQWETLNASFVDIHYQPANRADADLYAELFEATHRALREEFSADDVDALMQQPVRCGVWIHPRASGTISAASTLASTSSGSSPYCELHFLAPSAYSPKDRCCTKVGEVRDRDQLHRIVAHEYATIALERLTRRRSGWQFHSAPKWFEQGYEEYLGCMLATGHTRTVTLGKYREMAAQNPTRFRDGAIDNPYIDGAVLLQYLHEEFGRQRVQAVLADPATSFDAALGHTLGLTPSELFERVGAKLQASR